MSDYLTRLAERVAAPEIALRPRTLSLFEPVAQSAPAPPLEPPESREALARVEEEPAPRAARTPADIPLPNAPASPAFREPPTPPPAPALSTPATLEPRPALLVAPAPWPDREPPAAAEPLAPARSPVGEVVPARPPAGDDAEPVEPAAPRPRPAVAALASLQRPPDRDAPRVSEHVTSTAAAAPAPAIEPIAKPGAQVPVPPPALVPMPPAPRMRAGENARRDAPAPPPAIHVTIGRLEIRAQMPPPGSPRARPSKTAATDLAEYLRRRSGGGAA
ncbi:MAG TPA: hypothetical protein VGO11_02470 [Chthoniobacteraceae bacterium]|jgi:hypothetical protein|nr:hypothetical protein [Chthoniobacteraceae bacterium]